jgi:hypothetical protein
MPPITTKLISAGGRRQQNMDGEFFSLLFLALGAALENFLLENKKPFWFHVHNQKCVCRPRQLGFFPTSSVADFVKHHIHQHQPPW